MRIICISDTHNDHERLKNLPEGDCIVHAGDFTHDGIWGEYKRFVEWYSSLPYKHKVMCPGNHDFISEQLPKECAKLAEEKGIHYLSDSSVTLEGIKFFGSPWTSYFGGWAFNAYPEELEQHFNKIPDDTNVLITHGPPSDYSLDKNAAGLPCGSPELKRRIHNLVKLKLCVFGHIHEGYGMTKATCSLPPMRKVTHQPFLVNASMAGGRKHGFKNCATEHKPFVLEIHS